MSGHGQLPRRLLAYALLAGVPSTPLPAGNENRLRCLVPCDTVPISVTEAASPPRYLVHGTAYRTKNDTTTRSPQFCSVCAREAANTGLTSRGTLSVGWVTVPPMTHHHSRVFISPPTPATGSNWSQQSLSH